MPLSEFRKKKLLYVFNTFFDIDKSGDITKDDIDLAVKRVCAYRGWDISDFKAENVSVTLLNVWEDLRKNADKDENGQISVDEWNSMWEQYAENPTVPLAWQKLYMNFIFDLEDTSGDGSISEDEFVNVWKSYGIQDAESREAFRKLQVGGDISREKFKALWKEYFSSDDTNAPGNYIFGKLSY